MDLCGARKCRFKIRWLGLFHAPEDGDQPYIYSTSATTHRPFVDIVPASVPQQPPDVAKRERWVGEGGGLLTLQIYTIHSPRAAFGCRAPFCACFLFTPSYGMSQQCLHE